MVGWWGFEDQGGVIVWKGCHEGYDAVRVRTSEVEKAGSSESGGWWGRKGKGERYKDQSKLSRARKFVIREMGCNADAGDDTLWRGSPFTIRQIHISQPSGMSP
jgi:hypothetical protein